MAETTLYNRFTVTKVRYKGTIRPPTVILLEISQSEPKWKQSSLLLIKTTLRMLLQDCIENEIFDLPLAEILIRPSADTLSVQIVWNGSVVPLRSTTISNSQLRLVVV